jgi:cyclophilin family peptidyl-prolyl cis-trans isomerase
MAPTTLLVVGRINSPNFQKARALAEAVNDVVAATVEMMLPADYDRYLTKTKLEYGSTAWAHTASVMVTSDSGYVGDDEALIAWLRTRKLSTAVLNSDGQAVAWEQVADSEYAHYLATSGNQYAFMDIAVDGQQVGRLLFELFATKLPKTCANFLQLCTGGSELSSGRPLHYRDSPIHRVVKGAWIQGGDIVAGNGSNGASVFGDTIPDESFCIPHDQAGVLGMANTGPHSAHSQFYVTMRALPSFDCKSVAFGRLIDGSRVLELIGALDTKMDRPLGKVAVCSCGKLAAVELGDYDQQAAAVRLQAIQRSRLARKEADERAAAASKMQAISKGRNTRKAMKEKK